MCLSPGGSDAFPFCPSRDPCLCLSFSFDCKCDSPPLQFYRGCISAWRENVCLYNNLFLICHAEAFLLSCTCACACALCAVFNNQVSSLVMNCQLIDFFPALFFFFLLFSLITVSLPPQLQYVQKKSLMCITFDLNICSPTRKDEERYIITTITTKALLPLQHTDMKVHGDRTVPHWHGGGAQSGSMLCFSIKRKGGSWKLDPWIKLVLRRQTLKSAWNNS